MDADTKQILQHLSCAIYKECSVAKIYIFKKKQNNFFCQGIFLK